MERSVSGELTVLPFDDLDVSMRPEKLTNAGYCQLRLHNGGNAPIYYKIEGRDPAQALRFTEVQEGYLPRGDEMAVSVAVSTKGKRPLWGQPRLLPFSILVHTRRREEPIEQRGQVEVEPRIPTWLPVLFSVFITVACIALGFILALN